MSMLPIIDTTSESILPGAITRKAEMLENDGPRILQR
jgi:hypothetical protein